MVNVKTELGFRVRVGVTVRVRAQGKDDGY